MKKIVLSLVLIFTFVVSSQAQRERNERIQALKTAYITDELSLTTQEAQKFWPVYNAYAEKVHEIRFDKMRNLMQKIRNAGGIDNLSDKEADNMAKEYIAIDTQLAAEKKKLYTNLTGIISSKKILKLIKAEQAFGKELLKRFRDNRRVNSPNKN